MRRVLERFANNGITFLGDSRKLAEKEKTLIVLGVARGGTSVISGTLAHLGLFTGERSREPVYEDVLLAEAIEKNHTKEIKSIIDKYNAKHAVWSFKRPSLIESIEQMHPYFRNPIYLIVFKDIFSIANRNYLSMDQDLLVGLEKAQEDYSKILRFLKRNKALNYFTFSYEKILQKKEIFVDTLIDIIGSEHIDDDRRVEALAFIEPNPIQYLDRSRKTKSMGRVEKITQEIVSGWGKYIVGGQPAVAELYINDQKVKTMLANLDHDKQRGYGFRFDLKDIALKEGDRVAVKLSEDVLYLNGSQEAKKNPNDHHELWFTQEQIDKMITDKYQKPAFLRDTAIILRNRGDYKNAYKVILKALELRPHGPRIQQLEKEIGKLI